MTILPIASKKEIDRFIKLPHAIYAQDPNWVAPLISEQKKMFDPEKNPMLKHCTYQLFLCLDGKQVVGRILTFVDHLANEFWRTKLGFFGAYDCVNDTEASEALFRAAREWSLSQGMDTLRGPINLSSQEWGFVVKGFAEPPMLMSPYNPPYYNDQAEKFGLQKAKDLLVYCANGENYHIPARFLKYTDLLCQRYHLRVRCLNMKQLLQDVRTIVTVSNQALADNWGYAPVTDEEADAIARDLKMIVDPNVVFIVEADGQPIGFSITFPDLNVVLKKIKGRLLPFGIFHLLTGIRRIRNYRIWALGIVPAFQHKVIDTLLYRKTYDALKSKASLVEANYVLEDNYPMRHAIEKLGFHYAKTYRVYEMRLKESL